ncbi:B12-binding domain-containing radical SAM protein [candidate division CSSED10-310 bacterium]|uniref:B12-binding domain-containing radical SAM protein n=1 Tax=candidate division CSSED10-310 bacterium TaxID=2855610 RepID=A0ABV6Z1Z9_UNCC1
MRCLLLMPSWQPSDVFFDSFADSQLTYWQPTGLMYVAAALKQAGHTVRLIDGAFHDSDWIELACREFQPQFIGTYSNVPMWENAKLIHERLASIFPEAIQATGGPTAIGLGEKLFEETEALHLACTGEGDKVVPLMVDALERQGDVESIPGWIIREADGILKNTGPTPLVESLDTLPYPARDLLEDFQRYIPAPSTFQYLPITTMISSRGCFNRCIYCFHINAERRIRYRSPQSLITEIEHCIKTYKVREIRFFDDNFCGSYERVMEFCELMIDKKFPLVWYCNARVDDVDSPLLYKMKQAGCWCVLYGIESGVQKNLDTLQKNITLQQIRRAVRLTKEADLKVYTPFIFGIPGETYEEGLESIRFALELDAHYVNFHSLAPFPGSKLYENVTDFGHIVGPYRDYNFEKAAFVPYTMTREQIQDLRELAFRKFYARPRYIIRRIAHSRNRHDLRTLVTGAKSLYNLLFHPGSFRSNG